MSAPWTTTVNGGALATLRRSCPPASPDHWRPCAECGAPLRWDMTACTGHPSHPAPDHRPRLYATITGTRRNLCEMARCGYRLLTTPEHLSRGVPPWAYALDNGAWGAHARGEPFDGDRFLRAVDALGPLADWIVVPDLVCGGLESLDLSLSWLPRLRGAGMLLLPVQDGMEAAHVAELLGPEVGIFVGGSTEWKEATMARWAAFARSRGAYCHVGRVNTQRRLAMVVEAGADSCDGTTATRFAVTAAPLASAACQRPLFGGAP